jgi:hypothetical protein
VTSQATITAGHRASQTSQSMMVSGRGLVSGANSVAECPRRVTLPRATRNDGVVFQYSGDAIPPSYAVEHSARGQRNCDFHNTSGRQLFLTGARTTRARSLAIALEPFLPGLVAPPCELVRHTLPAAKLDLVRRLPIEGCMRKDFVVLVHVPTY